jgi:hypothetical protein
VKNGDRWTITHVARHGDLIGPSTVVELDHADQYIPGLTDEPAWPTLRAHLLAVAAETGMHPLRHMMAAARGRDQPQTIWPPSSTGASQRSRLPTQVRCLGFRAFQKRSVAIRAGALPGKAIPTARRPRRPGQDHACRGVGTPAWGAAGSHPSTALVGEIAVWRAANGIDPQDPRPTGGGGQLDTAAALWKQQLDRHITRSTDSSGNETFNKRQAANTALSRSQHDSRRLYQTPGQRPNGPAAPGR